MRFSIVIILAIAFPFLAFAQVSTIKVPGQDWSISFYSPPLSDKEEARDEENYRFRANSGRFNISLFVESPQSKDSTHKDCYDFYWPKGSRNPLIAKDTIMVTPGGKFYRVKYDIITKFMGQPIQQRNVNYYIAFGGKWIDVHISMINPTSTDEQIFAAFDKSLNYGR